MGLIGHKQCELFALQLELVYLTWFTQAVGPIIRKLHSDRKSDWTADADDCFVLLTDVQH